MGASFQTVKCDKFTSSEIKAFYADLHERCLHESGHGGYTGTFAEASGITITGRTFSTREAAQEWLLDNAQKWENAQAVTVEIAFGEVYTLIGAWCAS